MDARIIFNSTIIGNIFSSCYVKRNNLFPILNPSNSWLSLWLYCVYLSINTSCMLIPCFLMGAITHVLYDGLLSSKSSFLRWEPIPLVAYRANSSGNTLSIGQLSAAYTTPCALHFIPPFLLFPLSFKDWVCSP